MMPKFIIACMMLIMATAGYGQTNHQDSEDHHHYHKHEIALANSFVYFLSEKESAYGLHLHYLNNIRNSNFGIGLGYERIFDDHNHNSVNVVLNYRIKEMLTVGLAPGIAFEKGSNVKPAVHFETSYEIEIGYFHLGPMLEYAIDSEDSHMSVGVHIGFVF